LTRPADAKKILDAWASGARSAATRGTSTGASPPVVAALFRSLSSYLVRVIASIATTAALSTTRTTRPAVRRATALPTHVPDAAESGSGPMLSDPLRASLAGRCSSSASRHVSRAKLAILPRPAISDDVVDARWLEPAATGWPPSRSHFRGSASPAALLRQRRRARAGVRGANASGHRAVLIRVRVAVASAHWLEDAGTEPVATGDTSAGS
jgi:hypothetical protein